MATVSRNALSSSRLLTSRSHSQPQTPELAAAPPAVSAQPPPLAPWASTESHKGPSLKEIQAAEARKAAKAEEAAAAARRAALEQEVMAARERERAAAQAAANSGLPTTSTWGSGGSPVTAGPQPSAWGAKPPAVKGSAAGATGAGVGAPGAAAGPKKTKTLAEIQREEEARKQRARELMMQSGANAASQGGPQGKRYADLAGRQTTPTPAQQQQMAAAAAASGGGWATVGAGGKVKPAPSSTPARTASAGAVRQPTGPTVVKAAQKAAPAPSGAAGAAKPENAAMDEFNKWMRRELSRGVSAGVNGKICWLFIYFVKCMCFLFERAANFTIQLIPFAPRSSYFL